MEHWNNACPPEGRRGFLGNGTMVYWEERLAIKVKNVGRGPLCPYHCHKAQHFVTASPFSRKSFDNITSPSNFKFKMQQVNRCLSLNPKIYSKQSMCQVIWQLTSPFTAVGSVFGGPVWGILGSIFTGGGMYRSIVILLFAANSHFQRRSINHIM